MSGKRCGCRDPETGKQLGSACPKLRQRHHGSFEAAPRVDTSDGRKKLHRSGFATAADRDAFEDQVRDLVRLADDAATRAKIGDLIWQASRRGGTLPAIEDVRRRLALGVGPAGSGETFGQAWDAWLAGKKRLRPSSRRRLEQIGRHWLAPVLAEVLIERINAAHCAAVFDRTSCSTRRSGPRPRRSGIRFWTATCGPGRRWSAWPHSTGCTRRCGSS